MLLIPGYTLYCQEENDQDVTKVAKAGFKFMDVEIGARAAGMGEAFSLVGDNADAIFYNPAGIAQVDKKFDLSVSDVEWIAESRVYAVGLVANLGAYGNLGVSALSTDFGDVIGTIIDPTAAEGYTETGMLELAAYAAGLTYARRLTDKFMIGGNLRYAYEHLGETVFAADTTRDSTWSEENSTNTIVYDVGTIFYPGFKSLRVGMSIVNFSPAVRYDFDEGRTNSFELPLTFKMGAAMDVLDLLGEHPDYSLLVDFELIHPRDYTKRYHLGAELSLLKLLKLRAGYKFGYDEETFGVGAGIHMDNIRLDYAYTDFGRFDFVNRVSLGLAF
jgi:hypothetical protein